MKRQRVFLFIRSGPKARGPDPIVLEANTMPAAESGQTKRLKGSRTYLIVVVAALLLVVGGIELVRRFRGPHDTPSALPAAGERAANPFPRELKDATGDSLSIQARPQRIVSQTLGTDEILLTICPSERIVA